jgi:hypothetical protein
MILLMLLFSNSEININAFLFLFEFSCYQYQEGIKHPLQHFSYMGDTQMLLHILQGVKASCTQNAV